MTGRAWALFVTMSLVWGLPYLLIKVAVAEVEPSVVVFLRLGLAALVLWPVTLAAGALRNIRQRWRPLLGVASAGIVLPFVLIAYGEQHVTSSLAALLIASDPLFVVLLALRFDHSERATGLRLLGLLIGVLGVGVLVGFNVGGDSFATVGAAMVVVAALCYAGSALMVKSLNDVPRLGSVTVTLSVASLLLAPPALLAWPARWPSAAVIVSLLALSILCTALAYVVYFNLITTAGATRASLITYVNPAVAAVLGAVVLSEPITTSTLVGFGLIVLGCTLSARPAIGRGVWSSDCNLVPDDMVQHP